MRRFTPNRCSLHLLLPKVNPSTEAPRPLRSPISYIPSPLSSSKTSWAFKPSLPFPTHTLHLWEKSPSSPNLPNPVSHKFSKAPPPQLLLQSSSPPAARTPSLRAGLPPTAPDQVLRLSPTHRPPPVSTTPKSMFHTVTCIPPKFKSNLILPSLYFGFFLFLKYFLMSPCFWQYKNDLIFYHLHPIV